MASKDLSDRDRGPGDDQTFRDAEAAFELEVCACLDEELYVFESKPKDLRTIFLHDPNDGRRHLGITPDFLILSRTTGKPLFVEIKKHNSRHGNAGYERACRNYTRLFRKSLKQFLEEKKELRLDYHPFVTIFCDALATQDIYTEKIRKLIEPDHYLLWKDYDPHLLCEYLKGRCEAWLD